MAKKDQKEKMSLIREIFSIKYMKSDFNPLFKLKKNYPFLFWSEATMMIAFVLLTIIIFGWYIFYAISFFLK